MNGFYRSHIKRYTVFVLCFFGIFISFFQPEQKYIINYGIFASKFNINNSLCYGKFTKATWLTNRLNGYIQIPTFKHNDDIYDQYMCIINNNNNSININNKLIKINGINCFFALKSFHELKKLHNCHILSMTLIDCRRWNVELEFNNKIILLKCNEGIPNIKKLEKWNKIYDLLNNCSVIDLRFENLMVIS